MKINHTVLTLAMLAMTSNFALANNTSDASTHLTQIVTEAKKTQLEAKEIGKLLKGKNPDFGRVSSKMELLEQHVATVRSLITELESSHATLSERQRAELERMKTTAEIVNIFVANKKGILSSAEASRQRGILRAKADGIAQRAEMVQQSALRIRS